MTTAKPKATVKASESVRAAHDFDRLPGFLQNYIARKIAVILQRYEAVPPAARRRLLPPTNPDQLLLWEDDIEVQLLRLGRYKEAAAKV